jgi:hypothetical protein
MDLAARLHAGGSDDHSGFEAENWVDREAAGCDFKDERLAKRFRKVLGRIGSDGSKHPFGAPGLGEYQSGLSFFSNDRVSEEQILAGHFQSTRDRVAADDGPLLVLHDTTEFSSQREKPDAIGLTCRINSGRDKAGRLRSHTVCGILMHSSLAVTIEGIPLESLIDSFV